MKLTQTLLALFLSLSVMASIDPLDLIVVADETSNTIVLRTMVAVPSTTTVVLKDRNDNELYHRVVPADQFLNARANLSQLPRGKYTLELSNQDGRTVQPVVNGRNGLVADPAEGVAYLKPSIAVDNRKLVVENIRPCVKNFHLTISSEDGDNLFSERVTAEEAVARAYQLKDLPSGNYSLKMEAVTFGSHETSFVLR